MADNDSFDAGTVQALKRTTRKATGTVGYGQTPGQLDTVDTPVGPKQTLRAHSISESEFNDGDPGYRAVQAPNRPK